MSLGKIWEAIKKLAGFLGKASSVVEKGKKILEKVKGGGGPKIPPGAAIAGIVALAVLVGCGSTPNSGFLTTYTRSAKPTPKPWRGYEKTFVANYDGLKFGQPCPDRIVWDWGMGEPLEVEDVDIEECVWKVTKTHVFERSVPRNVKVRFARDGREVGSDYLWVRP